MMQHALWVASCGNSVLAQADPDADIPLPAEDVPHDSQSVDSRDLEAEGSDAEGEDLQENAERFVA